MLVGNATTDAKVGGACESADTRAALFFSDQNSRRCRWDSTAHIQQATFREFTEMPLSGAR